MFASVAAETGQIRCGYDSRHEKVPLETLEDDKQTIRPTGREHSIFAFKDGAPYLELTGGDLTSVSYSPLDKAFTGGMARIRRLPDGSADAKVIAAE